MNRLQRVEVPVPEALVDMLREADREARAAIERFQWIARTAVVALGYPVTVADNPIDLGDATLVLSVPMSDHIDEESANDPV